MYAENRFEPRTRQRTRREALLAVAEFVESIPKGRFQLTTFWDDDSKCGCWIGWAAQLGAFGITQSDYLDRPENTIATVARKVGITFDDAHALFMPSGYMTDLYCNATRSRLAAKARRMAAAA